MNYVYFKIFVLLVIFLIIGLVFIFFQYNEIRFDKGRFYASHKTKIQKPKIKKESHIVNKLYDIYNIFPGISWLSKKVKAKINKAGSFTVANKKLYTVLTITLGFVVVAVFFVVGIKIYVDLINRVIMIFYGVAVANTLFNRFLANEHYKMLLAAKIWMMSAAEEFNYKKSVSEAVKVRSEKILDGEVEQINEIIDGENSMSKLMSYFSSSPIRILQTFAGISLLTSEKGDEETNGVSNYRTAIQSLVSEVNRELERINHTKNVYGINSIIPILSIFAGLGFSLAVLYMMPGLSLMINGSYGYISKIFVNIIALIVFVEVEKATQDSYINNNDVPKFIRRIIKKAPQSLLVIISPTDLKKQKKININIEKARSRHSIKSFRLTKLVYGTSAFVIAVMFMLISNIYGLDYLSKTLDGADGGKLEPDKQVVLKEIDDNFIYMSDMNEEEIYNEIKNKLDLKDSEIDSQIERMRLKREALSHSGFDILELWIAIATGLAVSFVPNLILYIRGKLVEAEIEEDVMQMQTMITILMTSNLDTLDLIRWLANTSKIHKNILIEAWINFAYNSEFALDYMSSKTKNSDFKNICQKLKSTIERSSISEAFAELIQEKEHIIRVRTERQNVAIKKKSDILSVACFVPIGISLTLLVIIPMGIFVMGNANMLMGIGG